MAIAGFWKYRWVHANRPEGDQVFDIEVTWDGEIPEGYSSSDLGYITVPALPPEGCEITLSKVVHKDACCSTTEDFTVEVTAISLEKNYHGNYEYTVYVIPV